MAQFQFVMKSGPTPGATFPLEGEQLIIGRDAGNGVAINDSEVSRKHARLTFQGGKYVLDDLGSTNGTFVNGQRLTAPAVLKAGDVVSLGEQIVLMYEALMADAGATVAISRRAVQQAVPQPTYSAPPQPQPTYSAPPQPQPTHSAPPQPQPTYAPPPSAPKKAANKTVLIAAGAGALILICSCIGFLVWVDATYRWCVFFPFLSGC
ncbi:MAG: FHA domain-containing protein [Anaerolineales bacterium]|nr:FHA domain-containing protein [Anaerolineales bacterium]